MPVEIVKPNLMVLKSQSDIIEDYKPFITKGFVSKIVGISSLQLIKKFRDTRASQTLMLYYIYQGRLRLVQIHCYRG